MRKRHLVAGLAVAAITAVGGPALPAAGQDLDCDSPGVGVDIPVRGEDPNGFDRDDDGIGCESDGSDTAPVAAPAAVDSPAEPAEPAGSAASPAVDRPELAHTGTGTVATAVTGLALAVGGGAALLAAHRWRPRHLARRPRA